MTLSGPCPRDGLARALRPSVEMEEISLHLRTGPAGPGDPVRLICKPSLSHRSVRPP